MMKYCWPKISAKKPFRQRNEEINTNTLVPETKTQKKGLKSQDVEQKC